MTALADALVAAQRRAITALEKQYAAGRLERDTAARLLTAIGTTDDVDQERLLNALDVIRAYGAELPSEPATNGEQKPEPATEAQLKFIAKLADEKGYPMPDGPLTKVSAHEIIGTLKAGTYEPEKWHVPF